MLRQIFFILVVLTSLSNGVKGQSYQEWFNIDKKGQRWVDSVFSTLSFEKKIGQLFMVSAYSDSAANNAEEIACLIKEYGIGGVCFFKGGPYSQVLLTRYFQSLSKVPLLISQDAEWGLSMRLDSTVSYPKQMALGTLTQDSLIYAFGRDMAAQCKRMGIHISFSPVLDVNNNPLNPIISDRSFGENKEAVTHKGLAYAKGLEDHGVMACVKHFPGHGNTESDSHHDLPVIHSDLDSLKSTEFVPFRELFQEKVKSVMAAHLYIPALDSTPDLATSLSPKVVKNLLRNNMGFGGLVFTDGLNMKGVARYRFPRQLNLAALQAGNDVLLCAEDVPGSVPFLSKAIRDSLWSIQSLDSVVKRILAAKYWCGLHTLTLPDTHELYISINHPASYRLRQSIAGAALCVVSDDGHLIPPSPVRYPKMLSLSVGSGQITPFQRHLKVFLPVHLKAIDKQSTAQAFDSTLQAIDSFDLFIVSVQNTSRFLTRKYGMTPEQIRFINRLPKQKTILVHFGNVYALDSFPSFTSLLQSHEDWEYYQWEAAKAIGGIQEVTGMLPVNISGGYRIGSGRAHSVHPGVGIGFFDEVGMDPKTGEKIDVIMQDAIRKKAMPGGQVLLIKDGRAVWHKSYGTAMGGASGPVRNDQRYDVASITKAAATTLAIMALYEDHKIKLTDKIALHVKEYKKTPKKNITIAELLTHQAGLPAWVPFYKEVLKHPDQLSSVPTPDFNIQLSDSLWMHRRWKDSIYVYIKQQPIQLPGKYVYSDLGFMILQQLVERVSHMSLDSFVKSRFYQPMELANIGFNPFDRQEVIPSNVDLSFRNDTLQGFVHDPAAAMLGGVSGHAGLFSNAWDLGCIFQMLLDSGKYRGKIYFKPNTVQRFTHSYFEGNRRGLGFDKPAPRLGDPSPCPPEASLSTFGHQGFTGTCVWADPEKKLICVVLCNRTFPDEGNTTFNDMQVRTAVFQTALKACSPIYRGW